MAASRVEGIRVVVLADAPGASPARVEGIRVVVLHDATIAPSPGGGGPALAPSALAPSLAPLTLAPFMMAGR